MNKKQLASIERNRAKRLAREAKAQEPKVSSEDRFNNIALTPRIEEILKREIDDAAFDVAVENFLGKVGGYVPRELTIKMYQDGWLSNGLASLGVNCTTKYHGMGQHQAYRHNQLYITAVCYLKKTTEIPVE